MIIAIKNNCNNIQCYEVAKIIQYLIDNHYSPKEYTSYSEYKKYTHRPRFVIKDYNTTFINCLNILRVKEITENVIDIRDVEKLDKFKQLCYGFITEKELINKFLSSYKKVEIAGIYNEKGTGWKEEYPNWLVLNANTKEVIDTIKDIDYNTNHTLDIEYNSNEVVLVNRIKNVLTDLKVIHDNSKLKVK